MTTSQKLENEQFFKKVIQMTLDGGFYFYPNGNQVYQILDGKMCGNEKGIEIIKRHTTENFHKNLVVSEL